MFIRFHLTIQIAILIVSCNHLTNRRHQPFDLKLTKKNYNVTWSQKGFCQVIQKSTYFAIVINFWKIRYKMFSGTKWERRGNNFKSNKSQLKSNHGQTIQDKFPLNIWWCNTIFLSWSDHEGSCNFSDRKWISTLKLVLVKISTFFVFIIMRVRTELFLNSYLYNKGNIIALRNCKKPSWIFCPVFIR